MKKVKFKINRTWKCPKCGKVLPSGIVGISSHWSECGGREFHKELIERIKEPSFGIDELKEMQERHYKPLNK